MAIMETIKMGIWVAALALVGCGGNGDEFDVEPLGTEALELPVQIGPICVRAQCDQPSCAGNVTISQTVPANTGPVEVWNFIIVSPDQSAAFNYTGATAISQTPGNVTTATLVPSFLQGGYACLLTSVVGTRARMLQPLSVTATVQ